MTFTCRYGRDYYINDAKTASGSRTLRTSGNLNRHRTIDDDNDGDDDEYDDDGGDDGDENSPENDYDVSDSVSDLDSFYSNRSENQYRYRYAHLPKPMTLQMKRASVMQSPPIDVQLKRSQSLCSVRMGLRILPMKRNDLIATSLSTLGQRYEKSERNDVDQRRPQGGQVIAQLERDTLHSNIYRNSLSSRRGTRNFVINPLYNERNTAAES